MDIKTIILLFSSFIRIGTYTFGGGYAMLPLIQEQVMAYGWLTEEELINFIAVSESTPGPFAINISTYVGVETGGLFQESRIIKGCMSGLKPAVIGPIASAVVSTGKTVFFPNGVSVSSFLTAPFIISALIFLGMLVLALKKVHPIIIIVLSGIIGIVVGYLQAVII